MTSLVSNLRPFALWRDRSGAFSAPRAVALAVGALPAAHLVWRIVQGDLGPRPWTEISHVTGLWAIRLLAVTLAVTPLIALARRPRWTAARRILGVSVFCWMLAHLVAFFADKAWSPAVIATEIVLRVYLLIGFVALLMIVPLAATSTDAMVARLGAQRWRRLHQLTYAVVALGVVHFYMQAKSDISEPVAMTGIFALLGLMRLPKAFGAALTAPVAIALTVLATLATALGEAAWFWWKMGAPIGLVLQANFDLSFGLRPCWWPAVAGAALSAVGLFARAPQRKDAARKAPTPSHRSA